MLPAPPPTALPHRVARQSILCSQLPAFSRVQVCVPFNVLISPPISANVTYGLQASSWAARVPAESWLHSPPPWVRGDAGLGARAAASLHPTYARRGLAWRPQVDAEPAVARAISARVAGGTLALETTGPFTTAQPIKARALTR